MSNSQAHPNDGDCKHLELSCSQVAQLRVLRLIALVPVFDEPV
jgi:hypothetical protein